MIQAVEINNFQSHKYTLMEFSPGINAIVGPSDEGKSAIIRAIGWCVQNDPAGFAFRSYFAGKNDPTSVAVSLDDERWVVRERGEATNRYRVWNIKDPLEAFGQGPVKEVLETFNLSNFSIQGQHEQYFLLQSSPGEVSRALNELTGLGISDDVLKKIGSMLYKAREGLSNAEEQIVRLAEEIKEYAYLDKLEIELARLEKALQERELARDERRGVLDLVGKIENANTLIQDWDEWLEIEKDAQGLINETQDFGVLVKERDLLQQVVSKVEALEKEVKDFEAQIQDYQSALKLQEELREVFHLRKEYRDIAEYMERAEELEMGIVELDERLVVLNAEKEKYGIICQNCGARVEL